MLRKPNRKPPSGHDRTKCREVDPPWVPVRLSTRIEAARAGLVVWMDAEEAAEYLGVSAARFREAAARGEIDRYKDLGGYRYHRDDLDRWRRSRGARAS